MVHCIQYIHQQSLDASQVYDMITTTPTRLPAHSLRLKHLDHLNAAVIHQCLASDVSTYIHVFTYVAANTTPFVQLYAVTATPTVERDTFAATHGVHISHRWIRNQYEIAAYQSQRWSNTFTKSFTSTLPSFWPLYLASALAVGRKVCSQI